MSSIGLMRQPISKVRLDRDRIEIQLPPNGGSLQLVGQVGADEITGTWTALGQTGRFQLHRKPADVTPYREEPVRFRNGTIDLAGSLLLPEGKGPFPAVVFVHASGPATRDASRFLADQFARRRVAVLIYDKRGTGESKGDYRKSTFDDLAGDALVAVELLSHRDDILPNAIGLHGTSQGGWIAPLAASRSNAIHFLILVSGPAVSPEASELFSVQANMRSEGYDEAAITAAVALAKLKFQFARTGEGWEEYSTAAEKAKGEKWFPLVRAPLRRDNSSFTAWKLINSYDPIPALQNLRCPVLAIFGGADTTFDVPDTVAKMRAALAKTSGAPATGSVFKVFADATHDIYVWSKPGEPFSWPVFAEGYLDLTFKWLLEHTTLASDAR